MATPRWKEITNALEQQIVNGDLVPGDRLPTEEDIATSYSVSRVTAHRAIRELQVLGLVTRQRRWGTVVAERSQVKTKRIGLIFDFIDPEGSFPQPSLLRGIQSGLSDEYAIILADSQDDPAREADLIAKYSEEADGIIILPTSAKQNTSALQGLVKRKFPMVMLDRVPEGVSAPVVLSDNYETTFTAIETLISRGHRNIAFLSFHKPNFSTVRDRYQAFQDALKAGGIEPNEDFVRFFTPDLEHTHDRRFGQMVKDAVYRMVTRPQPATAVFCVQDMFVPEVLEACAEAGKQVPDEIEVASFNDFSPMVLRKPWAVHRIVPRVFEIGEVAGQMLVKQMSGKTVTPEAIQVHADFHPADLISLRSPIGNVSSRL